MFTGASLTAVEVRIEDRPLQVDRDVLGRRERPEQDLGGPKYVGPGGKVDGLGEPPAAASAPAPFSHPTN